MTCFAQMKSKLLSMAAEDLRVREELASDGALFEGYHPRMREVHERNAMCLSAILDKQGWPHRSSIGKKAAEAAWLILQHAIGNPTLQRRGLELLRGAAEAGEASMLHVAMLKDRIRAFEGRDQLYGTQFDWDESGVLNPLPIEDEGNVDERRRRVGLPPLAQDIQKKREAAARSGERPPTDWGKRQREKEHWLRDTGWRK
jgi:hypothetical protein